MRKRSIHERDHGKKIDFSIARKCKLQVALKNRVSSRSSGEKNMFYVLDRDWRVAEFIKD